MTPKKVEPRKKRSLGVGVGVGCAVAFVFLLLPILYVLSIGPATMLYERRVISFEAGRTFYAPVIWLHDHTPLGPAIEWYEQLWI